VFFRASTQAEAQRLNLRGTVRNLADGRVEVVACGPNEALEALSEWLHDGPPQARVDRVEEAADAPEQIPTGFEVR
jgi:acylphosphatase